MSRQTGAENEEGKTPRFVYLCPGTETPGHFKAPFVVLYNRKHLANYFVFAKRAMSSTL